MIIPQAKTNFAERNTCNRNEWKQRNARGRIRSLVKKNGLFEAEIRFV